MSERPGPRARSYRNALIVLLSLTGIAGPCAAAQVQRAAQVAGSDYPRNIIKIGWTHIRPDISNGAPRNQLRANTLLPLLGVERNFRSEGVDLTAGNLNTLALGYERFITRRLSVNFIGGFPRKASIQARGQVAPTGPTGRVNNIDLGDRRFGPTGRARLWAPAVTVNYRFGRRDAAVQPYAGVGINYTWFTEEDLNDELARAVNRQFGGPLALANGSSGDTSTRSYVEADYAPVFLAGLAAPLTPRWQLDFSASYVPLSTTAHVIVEDDNGEELARSRTRIDFDSLVFQLTAGYQY